MKILFVVALLIATSPAKAQQLAGEAELAAYTSAYGVSVDEAKRRFSDMAEANSVQQRLEAEQPIRFAGLYIDHIPKFRVVVKLVGNAEGLLARYTTNPAFVAEKAPFPLVALRNKQEAVVRSLSPNEKEFGTEVDVRGGRVAVYVSDPVRAKAALSKGGLDDDSVEYLASGKRDELVAAVRGGELLRTATDNAGYYDEGTIGFVVTQTVNQVVTRGVLTAGHVGECINAGSSCVRNSPITSQGVSLTWKAQLNAGSDDFEWRTGPAGTTYPNTIKCTALSGCAGSTMTITGTADPTTFPVGTIVCKQGSNTGYTCGTIEAVNSSTTYNGATGYWVRVKNSTGAQMTNTGDSGGPVFGAATAYGIVHSRVTSPADQVGQMMIMPIKRISGLNLVIATAP